MHYCSQQRGTPAIPLLQYTLTDIRKAYSEKKACAPFCTIACAHQASSFDRWRGAQRVPAPKMAVAQRPTGAPVARPARAQEPAEV